MIDREKVISRIEEAMLLSEAANECKVTLGYGTVEDALALLKAQELRHRLEVHNIGNVDVPEGVTWEQFQAVMSVVVKALKHTDRGESWPYDEDRR